MNLRSTILLLLLLFACGPAYAQLQTVYVDATNGSDSFSGANPTDSPVGTGPKATIHAGLGALANSGKLVIFAGVYAGDGVDTDGSPTNNTDNADININPTKYPRLTSGLTIELRALSSNNEIRIFVDPSSVRSTNGALINHTSDQYIPNLIFNVPGGVLSITTTGGTEYMSLAAAHSSGNPVSGLFLTAGSIDIPKGSSLRLRNGATITVTGTARFVHDAPQKDNDLNVTYIGGGAYTAGAESGYPSFGAGVLTVSRDAGSSILFPYSMSFSGNNDAVRLQSGSATFNGTLTLGLVGSASQAPKTADLIISTPDLVVFNAQVNLVATSVSAADSAISGIDVTGNGTVSFQQMVTWTAAYNSSNVTFPSTESTALVWNVGSASLIFGAGAMFTHAFTTVNNGPATVEVRIQNNGTGKISFGGPIIVVPRTESSVGGIQQFSVAAINNAAGTLEISGTLRSGLVNSSPASGNGAITITGPTTLGALGASTGALVIAPNKTLNLGSNILTLSGNVSHTLNGSTITATTGGFVVRATGVASFDGGNLPAITVDPQAGGVTKFVNGGTLASLAVASGVCSIQSTLTVSGLLTVSGGTLVSGDSAGRSLTAKDFMQTGGEFDFGTVSSGDLKLQGNLTQTGGVFNFAATSGGVLQLQGNFMQTGGVFNFATTSGGVLQLQGNFTQTGGVFNLGTTSDGVLQMKGNFAQTGGVLNLGGSSGGVLQLQGDFTRSAGTINQGTAAKLIFTGSGLQMFDLGALLQLVSVDIENTGGGVRLANTLHLSSSLLIGSGAKLDLGSNSVVLNGDGAIFTNNGSYTLSAGYGIVMGGATSVDGGANVARTEIHAGATSSFPSLAVDIGNANVCLLKGLATIIWNNTLALLSGALDVASPVDLRPAGPGAMIVRDVSYASRVTTSAGTFNAAGIHHFMRCIGNLLTDYTMAADLSDELPNTDSLLVDVNSDNADGDGNLSTGPLRYFQFPGGGFTYAGSLVVGPTAAVQLGANGRAGDALELSGTNLHHTVRGILTTAESGDRILVSGASVIITGSSKSTDAALIGSIAVSSPVMCTVSGVRGFQGSFTTLGGSSAVISMGTSPADQRIQGALSLNGSSFVLAGNLEVRGGISFNAGTLDFGTYNLQLTTGGDFIQGALAAGYVTNGGSLLMNRNGAQIRIGSSETTGLPNLQILSNTTLAANGRVTKNLTIGASDANGIPTLTLGKVGNDLIFTGSTISLLSNGSGNRNAIVADGTTNGTPGGRLFVASPGALIIVNGDFSIEELVYNPPAANGTLSILSLDQTPHVLTISDILTHAGGQIGLGLNHLALTGTGTLPGTLAYNRSDGTFGATSGELRFVGNAPQQFLGGAAFSVPNLRIWNAAGVTKALGSPSMVVWRSLDLSDGLFSFDEGSVIMEYGSTLIRRRSTALLNYPVSYHGSLNVSYLVDRDNGNLKTSSELPTEFGALTDLRISNSSASPDSSSVVLDRSINIGGTLFLDSGQFDLGPSSVSLVAGGTVDVNGGKLKLSGPGALRVSAYNLIYRRSVVVGSSNTEFQFGNGITVSRLSIYGTVQLPTVVSLTVNKSVGILSLNAPQGGIEFGPAGSFVARNLTITDSLLIVAGGFTSTTGTNSIISLSGSNRQTIALGSAGLTLPGGSSPIHLQLNNPSGFDLRGGDLVFNPGSVLFFANGVLNAGDNAVVFSHTATGQGFDRQGVTGKNASHIVGKVRQSVAGGAGSLIEYPNGRYEFPTGTSTDYRPLAITFTNAYPALNPGTIEVTHVDHSPGGIVGLPVDGGGGIRVGAYPNLYWLVTSSAGSFGTDQIFDLEATVRNPGFSHSNVGDLRLIRRPDTSPATTNWSLLGVGLGYGTNSLTSSTTGDSILAVRVVSAGKGLPGSNLVTIGLPTNAPLFTKVLADTTIKENQALRFTYTIDSQPVKVIRFALINPPAGVAIDSVTGILTWTPTFDQAGSYSILVSASDGQYTVVTSALVAVQNVNRKPVFISRTPVTGVFVKLNVSATFKVTATDPDNEPLTYTWKSNGIVVQSGSDSTYTAIFRAFPVSLTVVFADPGGLADSTTWTLGPDVSVHDDAIPTEFALEQNYPNPFNPTTNLEFRVSSFGFVSVKVFDMLGREAATLVSDYRQPGSYLVRWNASAFPSGIYVCQMRAGSFVQTRRMVLVK